MWQIIVEPHRGIRANGLWSVRLDGALVGIHASYLDAMHDAVRRAAQHWTECAADCQILVFDGNEPRELRRRMVDSARSVGRRRASTAK